MRTYRAYFLLMAVFIVSAITSWFNGESILGIGIAIISLAALIVLKMTTERKKSEE